MLEAGVDLRQLQQILGHYSIRTTERYTHLTTKSHEQANARIEELMARFHIGWGQIK